MEVVVGTYEELILGYSVDVNEEKNDVFTTSFTDHSHLGCVKTAAISSNGILATGSSDESIRLFSLAKRHDIGSLIHHSGTRVFLIPGSITRLHFFGKSHMFSTSEDGSVCVWKAGKWECLKTLHGHKKAVNDLAVHPSGKVALSVSADKTCRLWNLLTGKSAYTKAMRACPDLVIWSPSGDYYVVAFNNIIDVYNTQTAKVCQTLEFSGRIHAMSFIKAKVLMMTGEGGEVQIHDVSAQVQLAHFSTNTIRVKGMAVTQNPTSTHMYYIFTASSDGLLKMWDLDTKTWQVELHGQIDTKFRLTCLALRVPLQPLQPSNKKRTRKILTTNKMQEESESSEPEMKSDSEDVSDEIDSDSEEEAEEEGADHSPVKKLKKEIPIREKTKKIIGHQKAKKEERDVIKKEYSTDEIDSDSEEEAEEEGADHSPVKKLKKEIPIREKNKVIGHQKAKKKERDAIEKKYSPATTQNKKIKNKSQTRKRSHSNIV